VCLGLSAAGSYWWGHVSYSDKLYRSFYGCEKIESGEEGCARKSPALLPSWPKKISRALQVLAGAVSCSYPPYLTPSLQLMHR
jgi:hypothetical protein